MLLVFLLFRICKTGKNGKEDLILQDEALQKAVDNKVSKATTDNNGQLILGTQGSADPSSVVVSGFGVNGVSVPHKRPGARPQRRTTTVSYTQLTLPTNA